LDPPSRIYRPAPGGAAFPLLQGEIITNLIQVRLDLATLGAEAASILEVAHPFALILAQDCDLEQDFKARQQEAVSDKVLPSVLFCEVATAEELLGRVKSQGRTSWDRIQKNKDERYHFLQKVEPVEDALKQGLPELAIDFKRYFTIPADEAYKRIEINEAKRRCVLESSYLHHLSNRFASFLSRVALLADHISE
jgi:hypothetical protein